MSQNADTPKKLNELLCFSIYSANNAMNRIYSPALKKLNLTYPQYLVMLALWEKDNQTVGSLCNLLFLESSTVTPLLKRLETAGYVARNRNKQDERQVLISLTTKGTSLSQHSNEISACIAQAATLENSEIADLLEKMTQLREALATYNQREKSNKPI
ncbi:MAG: MarR family transcriptional regulator [OCS116 cluster bacterium]|uniref:MarR family transcriptional regulator n=1 Tax=OCS116 cluster bacterium TaxID=2030921 RepID=A0A2A4YXX7_9PROT|nr:MarR family transcriptional regulator [OCS116 cluster bacterium]